jgi:pre-rRNA-processing protein RIX1
MTHQYPTIIREITTPTLPGFITSCLNLVSAQPGFGTPSSLTEMVFRSFATLLPHHTTIFRPFTTQIRDATRSYLAPTISENIFAPLTLQESARFLCVVLHQTAAKNAAGEEWGKTVRGLIKAIHNTADNVFRAIIEDWESTSGHVSEQMDPGKELAGGGETPEDYPSWSGIFSGTERLTGLLETLTAYLLYPTSTAVTIPLGEVLDLISRILSVATQPPESAANLGDVRFNTAIDRDERDGLWGGMPQIHVSTLRIVTTLADSMPDSFISIAPGLLDQLAWLFPYGSSIPEFRSASYAPFAKILIHAGRSFDKSQVGKLGRLIRKCCNDIQTKGLEKSAAPSIENMGQNPHVNGSSNHNGDKASQDSGELKSEVDESELVIAAMDLLPLFLSQLPQHYLDISMRSLIERTAILSRHKDAMIASILYPFVGKNGKALASILPHLARQYNHEPEVEMLLRPRMPLVPSSGIRSMVDDAVNTESEDEDMVLSETVDPVPPAQYEQEPFAFAPSSIDAGPDLVIDSHHNTVSISDMPITSAPTLGPWSNVALSNILVPTKSGHPIETKGNEDITMDTGEKESSDDESIHLTMQLDTDSESE